MVFHTTKQFYIKKTDFGFVHIEFYKQRKLKN